jgi:hypothetical protein
MKTKKSPKIAAKKESHALPRKIQTAENWRRRRRKMSGMISSKV